MRTSLLSSILIACCITGCALKPHTAPITAPPPAPITAAPPAVEPEIVGDLPDPSKSLSPADVTELRHRLDLLQKGMTRDKALEILNLSSFNVRVTSQVSSFGKIYFLEHGHKLLLALDAGTDAITLRWAEFDGEIWPKSPESPSNAQPPLAE